MSDEEPFPGSPDDMMNTIATLRARVAKLEAGGEPNSYEARMDAYGKKIDELMARNAKLEADKEEEYRYAENLLRSFVSQHFPPNPGWKPLPDLLGVLTQIDNASTIARDYRARVAKLKAALKDARPHILAGSVLMQIDAALKDASQ